MKGGLLCAALLVTACLLPPTGNYARHPVDVDQKLADDAVLQLVDLYPPARTPLVLSHPVYDPFGDALVAGLRASGYSVLEAEARGEARPEENLRYVVDRVDDVSRLTLWIGADTLSRVYGPATGSPLGSWTRRTEERP